MQSKQIVVGQRQVQTAVALQMRSAGGNGWGEQREHRSTGGGGPGVDGARRKKEGG